MSSFFEIELNANNGFSFGQITTHFVLNALDCEFTKQKIIYGALLCMWATAFLHDLTISQFIFNSLINKHLTLFLSRWVPN